MKKNSQRITNNLQKGITLYLAMLMLATALTTAIFISTAFVREFTISKELADSLKAVYAADTVMEYTLYQVRILDPVDVPASLLALGFVQKTDSDPLTAISEAGAYYHLLPADCAMVTNLSSSSNACDIKVVPDVDKTKGVPRCPSDTIAPNCARIIAKGFHGATNRVMEIMYENL